MLSALNTLQLHISERVSESNYPRILLQNAADTLRSFMVVTFMRIFNQFPLSDASQIARLDVSFHNSHQHDVDVLLIALGSDRP